MQQEQANIDYDPDNHQRNLEQERKVFDNIHGFIRFQSKIWKYFIDTPEFQRLRGIKQLGCLSFVFPGATNTRFQHSLGTGHLAKTYIQLLIKNNPNYYKCSQQEKKSAIYTVTLAGLMHDVGHGPFSHLFDNDVVNTNIRPKWSQQKDFQSMNLQQKDPQQKGTQKKESQQDNSQQKETKQKAKKIKWSHQHGGDIIFRNLVQRQKLVQKEIITKDEVDRVVNLIHSKNDKIRTWEFQLISNKDTGIDVDKLDYFRRDAFYLGAKGIHIDHDLLMNESRIVGGLKQGKISYPSKYALQVNDIFYSRYKLYKTYYVNNKSKGIELMFLDIFNLVEPIFNFKLICQNIKQGAKQVNDYIALTDSIIDRIQHLDEHDSRYKLYSTRIDSAKAILKNIKQRNIYRFIRQVQTSITEQTLKDTTNEQKKNLQLLNETFNKDYISNYICIVCQEAKVSRSEFHVAVTEVGYGMKTFNPLHHVKFFRKQDPHRKILTTDEFNAQNISILYTKAFAQRYAKLYIKDTSDRKRVQIIDQAFQKFFESRKQLIVLAWFSLGKTNFYPSMIQPQEHVGYVHVENSFLQLPLSGNLQNQQNDQNDQAEQSNHFVYDDQEIQEDKQQN